MFSARAFLLGTPLFAAKMPTTNRSSSAFMISRPETMALANLLHHPAIGPETMSGLIRGRRIKRSNKDLGRVLALACLAESNQEDALLGWARIWSEALQSRFPRTWRDFVPRVGDGLRQLLQPGHEADLEEARHTCEHGLLVSQIGRAHG